MGDQPATLRLEQREQGVYVLWMDDPQESQNTLKLSLVDEMQAALETLERDQQARALVFISAKPDGFLAGANLQMLRDVTTAEQGTGLSELSQSLQGRIARLRCASVAAIHGACLGGGLELALAFDARVASDDRRTRLGLPEVQLGLLPGGGGTQRLIRLIEIERALDMLLSARQLDARQAERAGLVDEVVPQPVLLEAAVNLALERSHAGFAARRRRRRPGLAGARNWFLARTPPGRKLLLRQARARVRARTRGLYPAPDEILGVVETGLERGFEAGLRAESRAFGKLLMTPEARQLIGLFFATTELKKDAHAEPRPVSKVGVLGGGLMGGGIAYVSAANAGLHVRLKDRDDAGVARGLAYVHRLVDAQVKRRRSSPLGAEQVLSRVSATTTYSGFHDAPVVIEAVFEDLELKREMVREIEERGPADVVFASNTSALPIAQIAAASRHPETVIGMHYFSPVEKMQLLEIVVTEQTADWVTATCVDLGRRQGKTVIVVRDGVGFYTSRILAPFMIEALKLVVEGVPIEAVDRALLDFGFPVGPITLLDEVGIDVAAKVARMAQEAFGERIQLPEALSRLDDDKRLGRKNGRGFYRYDDSRGRTGERAVDTSIYRLLGVQPGKTVPGAEIAERCALAMVNEAVHCLGEGIIACPRDGDVGAVFGLGFPPFRGGPFRYLDTLGSAEAAARLEALAVRCGAHFAPAPLLAEKAAAGATFY